MNDGDREIGRLADAVARRYVRRCSWANEQDLKQEAWAVMLRASQTFDPAVGIDRGAYLWAAAIRGLRNFLWKESAPVSAGSQFEKLEGLHRAPVDFFMADETPWPDDLLANAEWAVRVRAQLEFLVSTVENGDLARRAIFGEERPVEIAAGSSLPVQTVYKAVTAVKRRVETNAPLWELWREST